MVEREYRSVSIGGDGLIKQVRIRSAGSGTENLIGLGPNSTPREIRRVLNLPENTVFSLKGGDAFGDDENIYNQVSNDCTLYAFTPATAGGSFLDFLREECGYPFERRQDNAARVSPSRPGGTIVLAGPTATQGLVV